MELYCGCGGLSFIDRKTEEVEINTKWAVDYCRSMCAAFKSNYPRTQVLTHQPVQATLQNWRVAEDPNCCFASLKVVTLRVHACMQCRRGSLHGRRCLS